MKFLWRGLVVLFWLFLLFIFADIAIGNRAPVFFLLRSMRFMVEIPVFVVFFVGLLFGVFLSLITHYSVVLKKQMRVRQLTQDNKGLSKEKEILQEKANQAEVNQAVLTQKDQEIS